MAAGVATIGVNGVEVRGKWGPRYEEILNEASAAFLADLHRRFNPHRLQLLKRREERQAALRRRRAARLPARDQAHPRRRLEGRADPGGPPRPPRRDHRPGRPQDDHQRAQLRRQGVHGRFRGRDFADLGQPGRGPDQPARIAGPARSTSPIRRAARPTSCRASRPCSSSARAAGICRRSISSSTASRCRARCSISASISSTTPRRARRQGHRPLLLSAEDGEPSRGAALERGLHPRPERARLPHRHDQGDRADRDAARRLRDGRDPLRAARPHGRAELRPLGLHLLLHQDAAEQAGLPPARPRPGGHGQGLPARPIRSC